MGHKTRVWIGLTLFFLIAFNYTIFGYPLLRKKAAVKNGENSILIRHVKAGGVSKGSEEDYVLEILRKEKLALDGRIRRLNYIALTCVIIVGSWTAFGLLFGKKR